MVVGKFGRKVPPLQVSKEGQKVGDKKWPGVNSRAPRTRRNQVFQWRAAGSRVNRDSKRFGSKGKSMVKI